MPLDVALLTERYPSELAFLRHIDIVAVAELQCISTFPRVLFARAPLLVSCSHPLLQMH